MEILFITSEYIELCNALKLSGAQLSGGMAKHVIREGLVTVDKHVEYRKKCKIRAGQIIGYSSHLIKISQKP